MKRKIHFMMLTVVMALMVTMMSVTVSAKGSTGPVITGIRVATDVYSNDTEVEKFQVTYQNAVSGVSSITLSNDSGERFDRIGENTLDKKSSGTVTVDSLYSVRPQKLGKNTIHSVSIEDNAGNSRYYKYDSARNKLVDESGKYTIDPVVYTIKSYDAQGVFIEDMRLEKNGVPMASPVFEQGDRFEAVIRVKNNSASAVVFDTMSSIKCFIIWSEWSNPKYIKGEGTGSGKVTIPSKSSGEIRLPVQIDKGAMKGKYYLSTIQLATEPMPDAEYGKVIYLSGTDLIGHTQSYEGNLITIPWNVSKVYFRIGQEEQKPENPEEPARPDKKVKVKKIRITGEKSAPEGSKIRLQVKVTPKNATNKDVKWKSSNTKVATVNAKGVVTLKKNSGGKTVTITATAKDGSGKKGTIKIKSEKKRAKVKSIKISGRTKMKAGKTQKLKVTVKVQGNAPKKVKWSVDNKKYATVSANGTVKAKKAGKGQTIRVTAKATDGSNVKATFRIKIK